jgi:UDP-glucose 4-epimerase
MKKLSILVTGGAGFVGSHIVDAYISAGHNVAIVDNLSTGNPANINPKAKFFNVDIRDLASLSAVFSEVKPDVVNHQAALASVTGSGSNPTETYEVNVNGTINVLLAAAPYIKKFIFASSGGALHAKPSRFPTSEKEKETPISAYGFSKKIAEEAVIFYARINGFDYTILRPANIFGSRQRSSSEGGVVAIFAKLAVEGAVPTIFGKKVTRDYVYVSDIASANVLALSKGKNEIVNLSTGKETSNYALYELIADIFSWKSLPKLEAARSGEVVRSCLSPLKAKKVLGWRPLVDLSKGISLLKSN